MNRWWNKFGSQIYLLLLHANFLHEKAESLTVFQNRLVAAATEIPASEIYSWIQGGAWREMLVASWVVALRRDRAVRGLIAKQLLASVTCFAGQGLCVATASYGDEESVKVLEEYLTRYLPAGERQYAQDWGIGALAWLERDRSDQASTRWLADQKLWELTSGGQVIGALDPHRGIERFAKIMTYVDQLRDAG